MRLILLGISITLQVWGDDGYFDTKCDHSLNRCFKFVSDPATYSDAEETCINEGGHLVSIENGFVGATIGESAKHAFSVPNLSEFWIGANFIFNNRWSWTDRTAFSYSKWAPGEPLRDQAAAVQLESSYWVNADPSTSKPFVCEISMQSQPIPTPTSCPKTRECDLGWIRLHDFCYKQFFRATFSSAEAYCKQHGAHLASIHGDEENNFVNEIAARGQPPKDAYDLTWIGMYRLDESSTWLWTDGTEVNYTPWINGVPNNPDTYNCIQTFPDGWVTGERRNTWNNWRCEDLIRNFVCKKLL